MAPVGDLIDIQAGYVLTLIGLLVQPIALAAFTRSGPIWQSADKGPIAVERELPPPSRLFQANPPIDRKMQETETRQMLEAKSYRRQRRGEAPLDIEAEMTRLLESPGAAEPALDEKLRCEVRQLVIAHNERRMRRGEQPLEIEAETERQLSAL